MEPEKNKTHWESWSKEYKNSLRATTKGKTLKDLEVFHLISALADLPNAAAPKKILECGCGNGFNLLKVADAFPGYSCTGFDFVSGMIDAAKENLLEFGGDKAHVDFKTGDLRRVREFGTGWDVIFTVRALINLASLQEQLDAVSEMAKMLTPDGCLIFLENCVESHGAQNKLREAMGLEKRPTASFNVFLQENALLRHAESIGLKRRVFKNVGSLHDTLLYVLLPKVQGEIDYAHPAVEEAKNLELNLKNYKENLFGSFGQVNLFVFGRA